MKLENKSIKQLKANCWTLCSEYNRQKDLDWRGHGNCCTCKKKILDYKTADAGHFMAGRGNSILFDDSGIHLQCKGCNMNQGEQYLYGKFMLARYGQEVIDEIERARRIPRTITRLEYIDMINEYKVKIGKL